MVAEQLTDEQVQYAAALRQELKLLQEMPQVAPLTNKSLFERGDNPQDCGVIVSLRCCKRGSSNTKKQIDQKFNERTDALACCSYVDAVRLLRAKISEKHGSEECLSRARADMQEHSAGAGSSAALLGADSAPDPSALPQDFFTVSRLQQGAKRVAELRDKQAKARLSEAQEEAACAASALADIQKLEPKRQRTSAPAFRQQSQPPAESEPADAPRLPPWATYDEAEFKRQYAWADGRRRVPLTDKAGRVAKDRFARGAEGPLHHWRRGLVGAVQDWAEGSTEDAIHLIVALIKHLQLEVCAMP